MKSIKIYSSLLLFFLLHSCDPVHSISIYNDTKDTLNIYGVEDYNDEYEVQTNGYFKLPPQQTMFIGSAIAQIDNDINFDTLIIYSNSTKIQAFNKQDIKTLFDRNIFNQIKTPYLITVK